jgi:hypothetical protein
MRVDDGSHEEGGLKKGARENDVFALTFNSDEHQLSIVNENGKVLDKIELDVVHNPFLRISSFKFLDWAVAYRSYKCLVMPNSVLFDGMIF